MTSAEDQDKNARHVYGPRSVAALVPAIVRPAFRKRAPAAAQLMADWDAVVGPSIAAVSQPRKLFSGTLSIACAGPMAIELQHLSDQLIARINSHAGQTLVTRLRFVQDIQPMPPVLPPPRREAVEAARQAVAALPADGLRDALEKLGRAVLAAPRR